MRSRWFLLLILTGALLLAVPLPAMAPPPAIGFYGRHVDGTAGGGATTFDVSCDVGDELTGGGWSLQAGTDARIETSRPADVGGIPSETTWRVVVQNPGFGTPSVRVVVRCADVA